MRELENIEIHFRDLTSAGHLWADVHFELKDTATASLFGLQAKVAVEADGSVTLDEQRRRALEAAASILREALAQIDAQPLEPLAALRRWL